jgi:hypothetical protein
MSEYVCFTYEFVHLFNLGVSVAIEKTDIWLHNKVQVQKNVIYPIERTVNVQILYFWVNVNVIYPIERTVNVQILYFW